MEGINNFLDGQESAVLWPILWRRGQPRSGILLGSLLLVDLFEMVEKNPRLGPHKVLEGEVGAQEREVGFSRLDRRFRLLPQQSGSDRRLLVVADKLGEKREEDEPLSQPPGLPLNDRKAGIGDF